MFCVVRLLLLELAMVFHGEVITVFCVVRLLELTVVLYDEVIAVLSVVR